MLGRLIQLYYPDNSMYKYKKLFNQLVPPRTEPLSGKPIIILWSNLTGSLTHKMDHFLPLISRKSNKGMKKRKIGQVNSKSSVTIQGVKKQKKIDKFLSSKLSKKYRHETVIQVNSEGGIGVTVHSGTTSKTFEQNTVAILNDICNVRNDVKGKGKHSESLGKPDKQNNVMNHEKSDEKEAVKESVKISGISAVSGKQNTVKGIESSKKNQHLEAQDYSKLPLHAFDICTFQDRVSSKMTDYQKYALIKSVFKPDQYFSLFSLF